jgi:hypothetical protein
MWNRLYVVVSFIAAILTILQLAWAGRTMLSKGFQASVPAWLLMATTITAMIFGWLLGRRTTAKTAFRNQRFKRIGQITFDYLPDLPTNHNWTLKTENDEKLAPEFTSAVDTPLPGSILISSKGKYRLDYEVGQSASLCNFVELASKLSKDAVIYVKVKVRSRDLSESAEVWLGHVIGNDQPKKISPIEWQISTRGEVLDNEWLLLKLAISDEVRNTFGRQGWVYQSLLRVRLRGTMSISPITLYRIMSE